MKQAQVYTVIGMMSGTSMDGVDAAVITTDGRQVFNRLSFASMPYPKALQTMISQCLNRADDPDNLIPQAAHLLTQIHANLVEKIIAQAGLTHADIDYIGFHGHSILHQPEHRKTRQIGNAVMLANLTHIPVIHDFRAADIAAGGQGAPLIPVYHRALVRNAPDMARPVAIVNLGGVGNVTYIGAKGADDHMIAFDTGPGNALIDDWVRIYGDHSFDRGGALGLAGHVDDERLQGWLAHPYFKKPAPKSLDRNDFAACRADGLTLADGAATLAAFTAHAVMMAAQHFPLPPALWVIAGGGRHNQAIMGALRRLTNADIRPSDDFGWDGDAMEAEGFALMAVRHVLGLPISFPSTTGCPAPMTGGVLTMPKNHAKQQ